MNLDTNACLHAFLHCFWIKNVFSVFQRSVLKYRCHFVFSVSILDTFSTRPPCANPESFVGGGPTLISFFLFDGRKKYPIPL